MISESRGLDYSLLVMHRCGREIMGIPVVRTTKYGRQGGTTMALERLCNGVPVV
jgi:hypothetical protein